MPTNNPNSALSDIFREVYSDQISQLVQTPSWSTGSGGAGGANSVTITSINGVSTQTTLNYINDASLYTTAYYINPYETWGASTKELTSLEKEIEALKTLGYRRG